MISSILLSIFFVLLPLVSNSNVVNVFEAPKLLIISLFTLLLLIFSFFSKSKRLSKHLLVSFLIFFIFSIVNLVISINPSRSFIGNKIISDSIYAFLVYWMFAITLSILFVKEKFVLKCINISGTLAALTGIIHFFELNIFKTTNISYDGRITGTIGQPNILGGFLVGVLPISWSLYKSEKKLIYLVAVLLNFIGMILTFSRGAYLAFIVLVILEIFNLIKKKKNRLIFVLILVVSFSVLVFSPAIDTDKYKYPYLVERFLSFKDRRRLEDIRFEIWRNSIYPIKEKPILGWGNSTYQSVYQRFLNLDRSKKTRFQEVESSHNLVVDLLVEWGIIGLALFILMVYSLIMKKGNKNRYVKYSIVAILIRSLFNVTSVVIFALLFTLVALVFKDEKPVRRIKSLIVKMLLIFVSIFLLLINLSIFRSEVYEKKALNEGDLNKAISYYENAINFNPLKQDLHNLYLSTLVWGDMNEKAISEARKSVKTFNDSRSHYYLGKLLTRTDINNAVNHLEISRSLNKRDPRVRHDLGLIYYQMGNYDKAKEMFLEVIGLDKKNFSDDYTYLAEIELIKGNKGKAEEYIEFAAPSGRKDKITKMLLK